MLNGEVVVLFDVDNTLFDNDRFKQDLRDRLQCDLGAAASARYWQHYEALRAELGYVDYLAALQRLRMEVEETPQLLAMAGAVLDYPFADRLYEGALAAVACLSRFATTAILSDGDIVVQPRKIQRSGIFAAVQGRVLVTVHKQRALETLRARFPATHYVMVDDKPSVLADMKAAMGDDLTTVFVRQGHYAQGGDADAPEHPPDRVVEQIAALATVDADWLQLPARGAPRATA